MFAFYRDDTAADDERFWFTVAPPFLEKDDKNIVYVNDLQATGKLKRFYSASDVSYMISMISLKFSF